MSVLIHNIQQGLQWIEQNSDPRVKYSLLLGSIWPVTIIMIAYLMFVLKIGPEIMKSRKPFNIDRIVMIYNIVQVSFSMYIVKEIFRLVWLRDDFRLLCLEMNKTDPDVAAEQIHLVWLVLLSKCLDLLDTVFFVLRKKQNQVTFLHVYHHTLIVTMGWMVTNFYPGGQAAFFCTINSVIHVVMYSYYLLTIMNSEYKKAWWKKYLTMIQLIQFVVTGLHSFFTLFEPDCDFPKILMMFMIPQEMFMFILFWDFYQKAYNKPKQDKQK